MKFIKLTSPDGTTIRINTDHISMVGHNNYGIMDESANSIIWLSNGSRHGVRETETEIEVLLQ